MRRAFDVDHPESCTPPRGRMPSVPDALTALADALDADPPAALADVDPAVVRRLADAVTAEQQRQAEAADRAVDEALRVVPRPLRGVVRRIIVP
jgi:hypothetical protein